MATTSRAWCGSIDVSNERRIQDVIISSPPDSPLHLAADASLRYLTLVDTSLIPLHLICGPASDVKTTQSESQRWFSNLLFNLADHRSCWWQSARPESPLGILVAIEGTAAGATQANITEILFYASAEKQAVVVEPQPVFSIKALPLNSNVLTAPAEPTPPQSPTGTSCEDAIFLPTSHPKAAEIINEPPVRKRRSVNEAFDKAEERRKKARRKGGEGVAAAAAIRNEPCIPSLKHRRSGSGVESQTGQLYETRHPRASSRADSRPPTSRSAVEPAQRSALSRAQSIAEISGEDSAEAKNKDIISRIVMAAMRLYGLSQTKRRKSRAGSAAPSPALDATFDQREADRKQDEEYKLVYHQIYKSTCFAFRKHICQASLLQHTEALRETVDTLLEMFCNDPLEKGLPGMPNEVTPGGRKAFGSAKQHVDSGATGFEQTQRKEWL